MKTFKVKYGDRTFKVFADSGVEAIERVRAVADAGWFGNTTVTVKSANDVSLPLIVSTVKRVAGRFVKKIMNGKLRDMTLILQVYVKDKMTGRFTWMELPITFMLDFNAANKVRAQNEDYGVKKLLSEIIQKIKTFENRTIYEDKALVADSAVADAPVCPPFPGSDMIPFDTEMVWSYARWATDALDKGDVAKFDSYIRDGEYTVARLEKALAGVPGYVSRIKSELARARANLEKVSQTRTTK